MYLVLHYLKLTLHDHLIQFKEIQKDQLVLCKWWPWLFKGHECSIGQNYSIEGNIFWDLENWQLNRGWTPITGWKKNNSSVISTEKTFDLKLVFNKQRNHFCTSCVTLFETVLIQVKTTEKDLLVLCKWWSQPLRRWLLNRSKLFWNIFGSLDRGNSDSDRFLLAKY